MKSEPFPRIVKGVDVSYSLDALKKDKVSEWDGVRNHGAQAFMRDMRVGDTILYYHSNAGKDAGAVGVARVVRESYPDAAQFDKDDPHYDPKSSKDNPRWGCVDIEYVRHLPRLVRLSEMKADAGCKAMYLFTRARLSVSPLRASEFKHVAEEMAGREEAAPQPDRGGGKKAAARGGRKPARD